MAKEAPSLKTLATSHTSTSLICRPITCFEMFAVHHFTSTAAHAQLTDLPAKLCRWPGRRHHLRPNSKGRSTIHPAAVIDFRSDRRIADTTGMTSWSDIPLDLAGRILHRLPAHVDRVRFGAVCPQWRAATRHGPLPPPLPLLLLSDGTVYSLPGSQPFHFPDFTGYTDACGDWLVYSGEEGCFLRDPLSNATMTLPPLSRVRTRLVGTDGGPVWSQAPSTAPTTMKCLPKWKITFARRGRDGATLAWMEMAKRLKLKKEPKSCKVWLCSSNLVVATINFRGGKRIAVCQPGASSWWSVWISDHADMGFCSDFVDMAFHQGKLYAIDFMATLFAIHVSVDHSSGDPWISQIQRVVMPVYVGPERRAYLVESRGVLLVVFRRLRPQLNEGDAAKLKVLEADLSQSKWFKVTAIGDNEVLFISRRCSRSVCVSHNALPGGCIFFLDNEDKDDDYYDAPSSCKVYSMTDGKVSTPLPTVSWKPSMVFGTWLFPQN